MLQALYDLYKKFDDNKSLFTDAGVDGNFFLDVYRTQPLEPELYEYFPLPAIFVDYSMQGQGIGKARLVTLTLHIVTDTTPSASNISEQRADGFKRFIYNGKIQELLEGCKIGGSKPLVFINENTNDDPVTNYHTQTYEFESYNKDLIGDNPQQILGYFETLNIFGSLNSMEL